MKEQIYAKAKENILSDDIGKYDLLESIFPIEFLLHQKPRQVKKIICETLTVNPGEINYDGFMSWIKRLRKKYPKVQTKSKSYSGKEDWRNFQPSEPTSTTKPNEPILQKVTYP